MKKIITLLFCTALFASAFAQTNRRDWDDRNTNEKVYKKDHDRDDRRWNNDYSISQRNMQIQRISNQYDYQIQQTKSNRSLSHRERKYAVKALQAEKAQQINRIYSEYNNRNVYNDNHNRNNDYRQDNRYNGHNRDNR